MDKEKERLFEAFLCGFGSTGEGYNWEYPLDFGNPETYPVRGHKYYARKDIRELFEKWYADPEGYKKEHSI